MHFLNDYLRDEIAEVSVFPQCWCILPSLTTIQAFEKTKKRFILVGYVTYLLMMYIFTYSLNKKLSVHTETYTAICTFRGPGGQSAPCCDHRMFSNNFWNQTKQMCIL